MRIGEFFSLDLSHSLLKIKTEVLKNQCFLHLHFYLCVYFIAIIRSTHASTMYCRFPIIFAQFVSFARFTLTGIESLLFPSIDKWTKLQYRRWGQTAETCSENRRRSYSRHGVHLSHTFVDLVFGDRCNAKKTRWFQ